MKEWAIKHPILTFLMVDAAIAAIANVVTNGMIMFGSTRRKTVEEKEAEDDEN